MIFMLVMLLYGLISTVPESSLYLLFSRSSLYSLSDCTKQVGGGPVAAYIHNSIAHTCKYGKVYQVGDTKNMRVKLTYHKTEFKMTEQHEDYIFAL